MRPVFGVRLVPSTPMNEARFSTAGSFKITAASSLCRRSMAAKEMLCGAWEIPRICPVSCTGKKPLGTTQNSATVAASAPNATPTVAG